METTLQTANGNNTLLSFPFECQIKSIPIKRAFDILFSFCFLLIGLPFLLIIALAIYLSARVNPFYTQERIGRGGKIFKCYKFRTMHKDAEQRLESLLESHPHLKAEWEAKHKLSNDPRIIPIGKILRKTSLDELPQFLNVLKGDLSIVGPRPVVQIEIQKHYGAKAYKILSIRPGITCLWQVSGRSDTSYQQRIKLDELYVDTQSFLLDLKLILKTVPAMVSAKGAY